MHLDMYKPVAQLSCLTHTLLFCHYVNGGSVYIFTLGLEQGFLFKQINELMWYNLQVCYDICYLMR